jgi:hypothetical protein
MKEPSIEGVATTMTPSHAQGFRCIRSMFADVIKALTSRGSHAET